MLNGKVNRKVNRKNDFDDLFNSITTFALKNEFTDELDLPGLKSNA